jgi:glycosyltransferase involved in cell wall biosynthesis
VRILYAAIDQQVPGTKGGSTHVRAVAEGLAARGHEVHVAVMPGAGGFPASPGESSQPIDASRATGVAAGAAGDANADRGGSGGSRESGSADGFQDAAAAGLQRGAQGRVHWHAMGTPFGRAQLRWIRRGALRALAMRLRPEVVIERYHNFGGEGLLAARACGARTMLEVNAPVIDYAGSPKARIDRALLVEPLRRWRDWQCRVADRIVTPTAAILPAWVPAARIIETEWGADTDRFRPDVPPAALDPSPPPRDAAATRNGRDARDPGDRRAAGDPDDPRAPRDSRDSRDSRDAGNAGNAADAADAADGRIIVMFVGAFRTWHGVHHLLRAMQQLHARGRHMFHAVLIGDGPERPRAEADIRAAGLTNVTLLGPRPHDQIPGYLAAADIGVAPFDLGAHAPLALTFYWSPLKVFEYMAAGLPVVAPDIPRLRAVVRPDEDGLLYDAARPEALADALERLADPARRAALGAAARAQAVQRFSWAVHCERLDDALQQLVDGTP